MKNNFLLYSLFLIVLLWMSCNDMPKSVSEEQRAFFSFTPVTSVPDSLLTSEQQVLKRKMRDVGFKIVVPQGGRLIVTIDKDSFLQLGLPEEYYNILIRDISDLNNYTDTTGFDFTQSFLESKNKYLKSPDNDLFW
ncbi:hypothetical protein [Mangrovibacterium marinum]|uniref:hypothetical protein n=1 Tax=Mangrovibacterium marinum TaxID=1639118 RepID=UPI002A18B84F|nr:hypothetical protein [Mangrovibacterium marinum]